MNPEQALQLLDSAIKTINANRATHEQLALAVHTLQETLKTIAAVKRSGATVDQRPGEPASLTTLL